MNLLEQVQDGYVDNDGVAIHYMTMGSGPLMILIHGFPEFWYSWRHQLPVLAEQFQVVAVDLRGYNLSDKPAGVEAYAMRHLVGDIAAVIAQFGAEHAVVVGHDWGGMVAWALAMFHPALVERLIICNLPHPNGLGRELAHNPQQQANSQYARNFQADGAHEQLSVAGLTAWISDEAARPHYQAALERSDFAAMLNYYKANYPRPPYSEPPSAPPKIQCPVLLLHGLEDTFLLPAALNDTWQWLEQDLTLVTVPGAGHFVHQDRSDFVTRSMVMWLGR